MQALPRYALIAAAVLCASPAGADEPAEPAFEYVPAYEFARPEGLKPDHDLSMKLSESLLQQEHFGGLPATVVVDASVSGDEWAFYISDISAGDRASEPEQMIRGELQKLRTGSGEVLAWSESVDNDMATAEMEWRFAETGTFTIVRANLWVTSAGAPHQLRAECIMSEDKAAAVRPRCEAAFAALTIKAPDRGPLGPLPTASKPMTQAAPADAGAYSGGASLRPPTDGAVLYNSPPKKTPEKDNTFLYVGGAILLIVAVYMVLRRSPDDDEPGEEPDDE